MNSSSHLKKNAQKMPEEIRALFKALSDDEKIGIIIVLLKEGKMTFNQMKKKFGLSSSSLIRQLRILQKGNLIKNFYGKKNGKISSFYEVTDIPESMFDFVFDTILKTGTTQILESDSNQKYNSDSSTHMSAFQSKPNEFMSRLFTMTDEYRSNEKKIVRNYQ